MHDVMPYDWIQGQGQGHGVLKFRKLHFSRSVTSTIDNSSWQVTTYSETTAQYPDFIGSDS